MQKFFKVWSNDFHWGFGEWSTYRRLRSNRIKIERRRYQRNEIQDNLANPKSFWRAMKSIFPNKERKSSTVQSIITDEGETITSKSTIVEKFNIFFTNTVSKLLESVQSTTILGLWDEKFTNESFVLQSISQNFIFKQLNLCVIFSFSLFVYFYSTATKWNKGAIKILLWRKSWFDGLFFGLWSDEEGIAWSFRDSSWDVA